MRREQADPIEPEGCGHPGHCNPDWHFAFREAPDGQTAGPTSPSFHGCRGCDRRVKPQGMTARVEMAWTALSPDLLDHLRMLRAWYVRYERIGEDSDLLFADRPAHTEVVKA